MKETFILKTTNRAEFLSVEAYLQAKQFTIVNCDNIGFHHGPAYFIYEYGDFKPFIINWKPVYLMSDYREFYTFPQLALFEREIQQLIKDKKQIRFSDIKLGEMFCIPNSSSLLRKVEKGTVVTISKGEFGFSSHDFDDNPVVQRVENVCINHSFDIKS